MQIIDKLTWIEIQNRKILFTHSKGKTAWFSPGGKREAGETDQQALIREIKEELTVDLIPDTIKYFGKFEAPAIEKPEGTTIQITCYMADYQGKLTPSSEVDEIGWINSHADPKILSPLTNILLSNLKEMNLID